MSKQSLIRQSQVRGTADFSTLEEQIQFIVTTSTSYVFIQSTPQTEWVVTHGFNRYPKVTIMDASSEVVETFIHYDNMDQVTIRFSEPVSGRALLQYVRTYNYTHIQDVPATTWIVQHNLNRIPEITVVDEDGDIIRPSIKYISPDRITVTFNVAMTGVVYVQ